MGLKDKLADLKARSSRTLASNGMLVKRPLIVKDDNIILIGFKEEAYIKSSRSQEIKARHKSCFLNVDFLKRWVHGLDEHQNQEALPV